MGRIRGSFCRRWLEPSCGAEPHIIALLRNGALLRWCVVALVAVRLIAAPPRLAVLAILWVVCAASFNTALLWLGERLAPLRAARVAQSAVLIDVAALVALVQVIFAGNPPDILYGAVALVLLEAAICWGAPGVLIATCLTLASLSVVEAARCGFEHGIVSWSDVAAEDVMVGLLGAGLVMARRLLAHPLASPTSADVQAPTSALRLTSREREVLALVAEGCSNTMIAHQLHLTESTVKGHVESILNRLNVRNRTGAAVVASRLGLLD